MMLNLDITEKFNGFISLRNHWRAIPRPSF